MKYHWQAVCYASSRSLRRLIKICQQAVICIVCALARLCHNGGWSCCKVNQYWASVFVTMHLLCGAVQHKIILRVDQHTSSVAITSTICHVLDALILAFLALLGYLAINYVETVVISNVVQH